MGMTMLLHVSSGEVQEEGAGAEGRPGARPYPGNIVQLKFLSPERLQRVVRESLQINARIIKHLTQKQKSQTIIHCLVRFWGYGIVLRTMANIFLDSILNPVAALQSTIEDFLESFQQAQNPALADIINCVLRSCGSNDSVDADRVVDYDGIVDALDDFTEVLKEVCRFLRYVRALTNK